MNTRDEAARIIAVDLGGTKLATTLADSAGRLTRPRAEPTELSNRDACVEQVANAVQAARRDSEGTVRAVGVSIPGLARRDGTVWAPNLPGWKRVPLSGILERATGLPVVVESDRNASVIGEAWKGSARGAQDAVCLIVGTGIGLGILSGGRLVRGADELSGCAGWLVVAGEQRKGAGFHPLPSLETMAAGPGIGAAGSRALGRRGLSAAGVFQAAGNGDREARRVIQQAAVLLGLAVANIISLFNPRVVVLGGGVGTAGPMLLDPLRRTALRHCQPLAARKVRIVASRLGGRAPLLGAARLAWEKAGLRLTESRDQ